MTGRVQCKLKNFDLSLLCFDHAPSPCFAGHALCRYWRCYYSNTDAIIYVVDSADKERMGISKSELVSMLEEDELKKVR